MTLHAHQRPAARFIPAHVACAMSARYSVEPMGGGVSEYWARTPEGTGEPRRTEAHAWRDAVAAWHASPEGVTAARIVAGYLECAAWADAPEGSAARFTAAARHQAAAVCAAFVEYVGPELTAQALDAVGYSPERFGHDFWLTRCGHGAGFWDRDELDAPACTLPALRDRDGHPSPIMQRGKPAAAADLGDVLSAAAYGTDSTISPFAYPSLQAYGGWLTFADSAGFALTGGPNVWPFWQQWTARASVPA